MISFYIKFLLHLYRNDVGIIILLIYLFLIITFLKFIYFICLFLAVLGLRCCSRAFSSCGEQGLLFIAVHGLLTAVASLVEEQGL